jgi:hypothetical protein
MPIDVEPAKAAARRAGVHASATEASLNFSRNVADRRASLYRFPLSGAAYVTSIG